MLKFQTVKSELKLIKKNLLKIKVHNHIAYLLLYICMDMSSRDPIVLPWQDRSLPCLDRSIQNVSHKLKHCSLPSLSALSSHRTQLFVDF